MRLPTKKTKDTSNEKKARGTIEKASPKMLEKLSEKMYALRCGKHYSQEQMAAYKGFPYAKPTWERVENRKDGVSKKTCVAISEWLDRLDESDKAWFSSLDSDNEPIDSHDNNETAELFKGRSIPENYCGKALTAAERDSLASGKLTILRNCINPNSKKSNHYDVVCSCYDGEIIHHAYINYLTGQEWVQGMIELIEEKKDWSFQADSLEQMAAQLSEMSASLREVK